MSRLLTWLALWGSAVSAAQISLPFVTANAGGSVGADVQFMAQGTQVTGFQFDLQFDSSLTITATIGAVGSIAGKSLYTSDVTPALKRFLVVGLNQTAIQDGAVLTLNISLSFAAVENKQYPLHISNAIATDKDGKWVALSAIDGATWSFTTQIAVAGVEFYPVTPCRLVDTRVASFQSGFGPPFLSAGTTRTFPIPSHNTCVIPATAVAYVLNSTVVTKGYLGYLTIWPAGQPMPNVSTLDSYSNSSTTVSNAAIVPAGTNGAINVYVTDATDVIIDIYGYFAPPSPHGLLFYPITPCRLVDTRVDSFQSGFGPPSLSAGTTRSFPIPSNDACGIPATAMAYSQNITVVTEGYLGILSIWPTGQPMPNVSTLNSYSSSSTAVANAAIVPAGSGGAINVFVTDATDLVIDIDGYFAPPAANGLKFYPTTPCRVADTRVASFPPGLGPPSILARAQRSFPVPTSTCGIPNGARAYSLNFTAVPHAPQLGIFTTWPTGLAQPNVSTMNSYNGSVVANAAIVPAGTNGAISIYVTDATDVLFDINGYFAP